MLKNSMSGGAHEMLKWRPELWSSLRPVPGRVTLCSTSVLEGYVHDPVACLRAHQHEALVSSTRIGRPPLCDQKGQQARGP